MFDFAGRAKFDSWAHVGNEMMTMLSLSDDGGVAEIKAQARRRYVEAASINLGFDPQVAEAEDSLQDSKEDKGKRREEDMTPDELLDRDEDEGAEGSDGKGMTFVSTMRLDDGEQEASMRTQAEPDLGSR